MDAVYCHLDSKTLFLNMKPLTYQEINDNSNYYAVNLHMYRVMYEAYFLLGDEI